MDWKDGGNSVQRECSEISKYKWEDGECQTNNGRSNASHSNTNVVKRSKGGREFRWLIIKEKIKRILQSSFQFPISEIRLRESFRKDSTLTNPDNAKYVEFALKDFLIDVNKMSLREFFNMYEMREDHIFDSSRYATNSYFSLEESTKILNDLLKFQFNDDEDEIKKFLTSVVDIIDKRVAKLNTLVICSPPSGGKNYFLDTIFCILINIGYLGTANKTNNFAFQEAPDKRALVWNEVNYEPAMTDMCKQLTGGDTCKVRVKNNPDTYVSRTPLFCMVNQAIPFMYDLAFQERVVSFNWRKADLLADHNKYPYPLSFFELLNIYNIEF